MKKITKSLQLNKEVITRLESSNIQGGVKTKTIPSEALIGHETMAIIEFLMPIEDPGTSTKCSNLCAATCLCDFPF